MLANVCPRKHEIQSIQSLRENPANGTAAETPRVHAAQLPPRLGGGPPASWGAAIKQGSLHAPGVLRPGARRHSAPCPVVWSLAE